MLGGSLQAEGVEAFLSAGDEEVNRDDFQPFIARTGRPGSIRSELGGSGFEVGIWIVEVHGGSEEDFGEELEITPLVLARDK